MTIKNFEQENEMSNPLDTNTGKPKRKKASGWDAWKAKKKAAAAVGKPTISIPIGLSSAVNATGIPVGTGTPSTTGLKNHYALILDRSGSMGRIRDAAIAAFNEQVQAVRLASRGQTTDVSLFPFSTVADPPTFFARSVEAFIELNHSTYSPRGDTALYDAIIAATNKLLSLPDANDPNTSFLVCILTDGEENHSNASAEEVAERIKSLQNTKRWTFTFVGANVDVGKITRTLSFSADNSRGYTASAAGVQHMNSMHRVATKSFFSERAMGSTQSLDLYKKAEEALKKQQEEEAKKSKTATPTS